MKASKVLLCSNCPSLWSSCGTRKSPRRYKPSHKKIFLKFEKSSRCGGLVQAMSKLIVYYFIWLILQLFCTHPLYTNNLYLDEFIISRSINHYIIKTRNEKYHNKISTLFSKLNTPLYHRPGGNPQSPKKNDEKIVPG